MLVTAIRLPGAAVQVGVVAPGRLTAAWMRARPDVVYVPTQGPLGWAAAGAATRLGIPVVSGFHTNFDVYAGHYRVGVLRRAIAAYLRGFHNATRATLVATADLRAQLVAAGYRNVRVLGRGVDAELFKPGRRSAALRRAWGASPDDLVVLHVGRIAPEKNVGLAIEAYRAIHAHDASARLVIVGDGPSRAALQRANPDVVFAGMRVAEDLAAHYASGDVFLFPSETETFGNVTLEALASGLAVVAYAYAAARVHIADGESGALAPYRDARAFVARAVELARLPRHLVPMRRRARQAAVAAAWPRVVERFEALLADAAGAWVAATLDPVSEGGRPW
jgi:glycosyltransferase involved in cell wall biosynthesis